ncbi:MAG: MBL fold metallo-hydrolase [Gemmatimonadales bacterium]|nr:MAG: MBL fold metallo-hydrolase [Gemmatimonadales bacterium]
MRLTFLGTGTSFGVPQIGCACAVCRSTDPRDRRNRTAVVVQSEGGGILVDTPPELRLSMVRAGIGSVDAVLYTHDHADHTHGIDDLRALSGHHRGTLPVFGPADALDRMRAKFDYIFEPHVRPIPGSSRPAVAVTPLEAGVATEVAGLPVLPLRFSHGPSEVFGYRFGPIAYITDVKEVPAAARAALAGLDVLVLNALFHRSHPTHLSIPEAVETAQAIGARRTFLTHLTHETGHAALEAELPPEIRPAYDGLVVEV